MQKNEYLLRFAKVISFFFTSLIVVNFLCLFLDQNIQNSLYSWYKDHRPSSRYYHLLNLKRNLLHIKNSKLPYTPIGNSQAEVVFSKSPHLTLPSLKPIELWNYKEIFLNFQNEVLILHFGIDDFEHINPFVYQRDISYLHSYPPQKYLDEKKDFFKDENYFSSWIKLALNNYFYLYKIRVFIKEIASFYINGEKLYQKNIKKINPISSMKDSLTKNQIIQAQKSSFLKVIKYLLANNNKVIVAESIRKPDLDKNNFSHLEELLSSINHENFLYIPNNFYLPHRNDFIDPLHTNREFGKRLHQKLLDRTNDHFRLNLKMNLYNFNPW